MVSGIDDLRHDVQDLFGSARHAIDAQVDVPRWLEGAREAVESGADPKRWEALRHVIETQPDVGRWIDEARHALESRADDLSRLVPGRKRPFWARPEGATIISLTALAAGAVLGVVVGFLLDPVAGRARRARIRGHLRTLVGRPPRRGQGPQTDGGEGIEPEVTERMAIPVVGDPDAGSALEGGMPVADAERPAPA